MKCSYCGSELKQNTLYCENCGKEVRMVPDYNMYDDEYLNRVLVNQDEASEDEERIAVDQSENAKREERLKKIRQQKELERKKKQQQRKILTIVGSVVAVLAVFLIIFFVLKMTSDNKNSKSYAYQLEQGKIAQRKNNLDDAIMYYKKAASLDKEDKVVRLLLADLYMEQKEYNDVIVVCSEILALDKNDYQAYDYLLKAYEEKNEIEEIQKLSKDAPNDENILNLFNKYLVTAPLSNYESGSYEEFISIELSSANDTTIYYTLNGDDPKGSTAKEYVDPIELNETGKYKIKAITKNYKGIYSDVVTFSYEIDLAAPVTPTFSDTKDGLDEEKKPIPGLFFIYTPEKEDPDSTEAVAPVIKINVPENCEAYYEWEKSSPSVASNKYDDETGIALKEGKNAFYVVFIDTRNDKCSAIGSKLIEYYNE